MRIVCISDTHSLHNGMVHEIPSGDVLIHSGDISNRGGRQVISRLLIHKSDLLLKLIRDWCSRDSSLCR